MNSSHNSWPPKILLWLYSFFLYLYPQEFRKEYRQQMFIVFNDLYKQHKIQKRNTYVWFIKEICADTLISVVQQQIHTTRIAFGRSILNTLAAAMLTFVVSIFLMSVGISVYTDIAQGGSTQSRLQSFTYRHSDTIIEGVFKEAYKQAAACENISDMKLQNRCQEDVGTHIAHILPEEELMGIKQTGWPTDLFFVKKSGANYSMLRWDGKITDVSSAVNEPPIINHGFFNKLTSKDTCSYFHVADAYNSCETYTAISLPNNETGYLVRMVPKKPFNYIVLRLLQPLLFLLVVLFNPSELGFAPEIYIISVIGYILFLILATRYMLGRQK